MDQQEKQTSYKKVIIILLILLAISLVGLAAARIIRNNLDSEPSSVVIPDNIITEEADDEKTEDKTEQEETTDETEQDKVAQTVVSNAAGKDAVVIKLFDRSASDNQPFNVGNMFPGDTKTHYYGVQVSYENSVTVHFSTHIRPGYEKLAEVLGCQVVEINTGRVVYDGLMKNMPESITHQLKANGKTTDVLYYAITAYLGTAVGNEYQNKTLVADFEWWVEDQQNLTSPDTGDITDTCLWFAVAAVSLLLVVLVFIKKKEEAANENQ